MSNNLFPQMTVKCVLGCAADSLFRREPSPVQISKPFPFSLVHLFPNLPTLSLSLSAGVARGASFFFWWRNLNHFVISSYYPIISGSVIYRVTLFCHMCVLLYHFSVSCPTIVFVLCSVESYSYHSRERL